MIIAVIGSAIKATIKVGVSPVVAAVDIVEGTPFEKTEDILSSAADDLGDMLDDIFG